ncbi:MAG: MFS transporter, partial [Muribaculaceae bacterium]|nr:MFS transporter [Muribaculaceae bacterium]
FWTVGLVQFFCWFAFLYLWTYGSNTVAMKAFDTPATQSIDGVKVGDYIVEGKNIILSVDGKEYLIADEGQELVKGVVVNGNLYEGSPIVVNTTDTIVNDGLLANDENGIAKVEIGAAYNAESIQIGNSVIDGNLEFSVENYLYGLSGEGTLITADIFKKTGDFKYEVQNSSSYPVADLQACSFDKKTVLNSSSKNFNKAGEWFGILMAVQALASVAWAWILPRFRSRKFSYILSLLLGGGGFVMSAFITNQWVLIVPYVLMGCAWAAMLAWPFTILTNSIKGGNIGSYLGLFNCTICIPQIVAAIVGGWILAGFGSTPEGLAPQYWMMVIGGISMVIGALCVFIIKEGKEEPGDMEVTETPAISENI